MTHPYEVRPVGAAPRRGVDILGLTAVIVGAVGLVPGLLVFLVGLIPSMNAIWWLGLIILPLMAVVGIVTLLLGLIGIWIASVRRGRWVLSAIGVVLGIIQVLPVAWMYLDALS
ncbi:hypothetical protein ABCS02_13305 [Microbacterium sp. X-17]|uniref:hypothetical protein n=1 Tax=Microbacterium sp. X-17 TaxID=3144404 RepID=UPI0031F51284